MTEQQLVTRAADDLRVEFLGTGVDLCQAAEIIIRFFRKLEEGTAGWKLWARAVYAGAIGALELLINHKCGG